MMKPLTPHPTVRIETLITLLLMLACTATAEGRMSASSAATFAQITHQNDIGAGAAAAAASQASGGRVLSVKRTTGRNGVVYIVKVLLPGGRMRSITIDGQSGQVRG